MGLKAPCNQFLNYYAQGPVGPHYISLKHQLQVILILTTWGQGPHDVTFNHQLTSFKNNYKGPTGPFYLVLKTVASVNIQGPQAPVQHQLLGPAGPSKYCVVALATLLLTFQLVLSFLKLYYVGAIRTHISHFKLKTSCQLVVVVSFTTTSKQQYY